MIEALIGLVGVVVGSFLTISKDSYVAWRQRRMEGSYSAVRLVFILHEYADNCVDVVQDDGTSEGRPAGRTQSGEEYYQAQVQSPEPPAFPSDIAWRSLPNDLMHQVLGLPNKARTTDRYISGQSEYVAFPPDYAEFFEARQEGYAKLGYDALVLAEKLSEEYGIADTHKADLGFEWDAKAFLLGKIEDFSSRRREQEARSSVIFDVPPHFPPVLENSSNDK